MIKIKLIQRDIHRNETTFRPFVFISDVLREIGIEFTDSDDFDFAFIGQASIIDKKVSLRESVDKGLEFLSNITGDYMIIDGQDSTSLMGTIDVFRESRALLFLKNSYLHDFDMYKKGWANGRMYWGPGDYSVSDIDELRPKMKLTGVNWLSTIKPNWLEYSQDKSYEISCMFGYPTKNPSYEHEVCQTDYYDLHRKTLFNTLGDTYNVIKLVGGQKVSLDEYYKNMYDSKVIMAPLGYGEMAPRDLESAMFGSILVKPDLGYLQTVPNIYVPNETYMPVNYDWSDLMEKLSYIFSNYGQLQSYFVENMRKLYSELFNFENVAIHLYELFRDLNVVEEE